MGECQNYLRASLMSWARRGICFAEGEGYGLCSAIFSTVFLRDNRWSGGDYLPVFGVD